MDLFLPRRLERKDLLLSEEFDCYDGFGQGIFQRRLLLLCILGVFLKICHAYAMHLTLRDVDHWCKQPQHWNLTAQEWKSAAIPLEADGQYSRCRQYANPYDANDSSTVACAAWDYDEEQVVGSMVSQWDLVCGRRFQRVALVFMNAAGLTTACIGAGLVADTIGRRPVLLASTVTLLISTAGLCTARTYAVYAVLKFIASGCAAANYILTGVLFFEVTTHENRPLQLVIAGAVAVVVSELWFASIKTLSIHWELKQAVFLAPTCLSAAAFYVSVESPRWLVAKARFKDAEDVMFIAANDNQFPLHNTACLLDRLKSKAVEDCHREHRTAPVELLRGVSIRKRAMAMFFAAFGTYYVLRVVVSSSVMQQSTVLQWVSVVLLGLSFVVTLFVITKVTMLNFTSACFALLGVFLCMFSLTATFDSLHVLKQALVVCAKALVFVAFIIIATYSLELFPTAVRGTACGWIHGFGGLAAIIASMAMLLENIGREDVAFAVAGSLMFSSLLVVRTLPRNTTVECAKIAVRRPSVFREQNVERMKKTLEQEECQDHREPRYHRRRSKSGAGSEKSTTSIRSRQH